MVANGLHKCISRRFNSTQTIIYNVSSRLTVSKLSISHSTNMPLALQNLLIAHEKSKAVIVRNFNFPESLFRIGPPEVCAAKIGAKRFKQPSLHIDGASAEFTYQYISSHILYIIPLRFVTYHHCHTVHL